MIGYWISIETNWLITCSWLKSRSGHDMYWDAHVKRECKAQKILWILTTKKAYGDYVLLYLYEFMIFYGIVNKSLFSFKITIPWLENHIVEWYIIRNTIYLCNLFIKSCIFHRTWVYQEVRLTVIYSHYMRRIQHFT